MAIIGISGKKQSGKDTVGRIIQIITNSPHFTNQAVVDFIELLPNFNSKWEIKKFANKPTDLFKQVTGIDYHSLNADEKEEIRPKYIEFCEGLKVIFHNDIWVKTLINDYKPKIPVIRRSRITALGAKLALDNSIINPTYPNWVITDVRFPNEVKAIEDRQGITIRINKPKTLESYGMIIMDMSSDDRSKDTKIIYKEHESEIALDDYDKWDYIINNDGTLLELVQKVREILIKTNTI